MKFSQLLEALKPSEYRSLVKGWDKTRYEDIFKRYSSDKKHYRIYIPLGDTAKKPVDPPADILEAVTKEGYVIDDYVAGIASKDDGKRKIKIGKLLAKSSPELAQKFANDPKRQASKDAEYYVVISRHPYDIAGMSTDRGWTSCMNLRGGVNRHYVPGDIKDGTLVAYLIRNSDKNINNPVARMLIKPFIDIVDEKTIAFGVQDKVYGTPAAGFEKTVTDWCDEQNKRHRLNGLFELGKNSYNDGYQATTKTIGDEEAIAQEKEIYRNPATIGDIKDPSERLQMVAVKKNPRVINMIKDPTVKVMRAVIKSNPSLLSFIKSNPPDEIKMEAIELSRGSVIAQINDPTEEMMIKAVSLDNNYKYITKYNPSEAVKEAAINHYARSIQYMENPSEKLRKLALKKDGTLIESIEKPSEEEQMLAANSHPTLLKYLLKKKIKFSTSVINEALKNFPAQIRHLDKATEEQMRWAIKHDGHAIEYLLHRKGVPDDLKMAAVKSNPLAIKWIENPTKGEQMAAVKEDPASIKFIKNPHPAVVKYVESTKG